MSLLADFSNDAAALAEQVSPRIVSVRTANGGQSSGFVWRTGLVVTADEALDGEDEVELLFADGKTAKAAITGRDPSTDVTLIKVDTAEFGDWDAAMAKPAALALVAGRGEGSLIASLASITEVGPAWRSMRSGQIDARIMLAVRLSGRSEGAAVVAPDGKLLGMAVSSPRRRTLVIPTSTIARAVATLSEKGYIPRGWLGVMLHPVGSGAGAILLGVEDDSPAAKAGLLVGDVITTWDGEAVKSVGSISNRLATGTVGSVVKLGVLRGGSAIDISVTLGERPRG
jgi:S1-C subfamily serine protease